MAELTLLSRRGVTRAAQATKPGFPSSASSATDSCLNQDRLSDAVCGCRRSVAPGCGLAVGLFVLLTSGYVCRSPGALNKGAGEPGAGGTAPQLVGLMNWYHVFSVESIADFKIFANRREVWLNCILSACYTHCHMYVICIFPYCCVVHCYCSIS